MFFCVVSTTQYFGGCLTNRNFRGDATHTTEEPVGQQQHLVCFISQIRLHSELWETEIYFCRLPGNGQLEEASFLT